MKSQISVLHEEQTDQELVSFDSGSKSFIKKNHTKKRQDFHHKDTPGNFLIGMTGLTHSMLTLSHLHLHCLSKLVSVN